MTKLDKTKSVSSPLLISERGMIGLDSTASHIMDKLLGDESFLGRYDISCPRYTSYPTANVFDSQIDKDHLLSSLRHGLEGSQGVSLYVHVPFCQNICYYCGCNKVVTKDKSRADEYLPILKQEIHSTFERLGCKPLSQSDGCRQVEQLHFGGGTPSFLSMDQIQSIWETFGQYFQWTGDDEGDYSIELDPRVITPEDIVRLRDMGFNRISIGVQDLDPKVQSSIHRIQPHNKIVSLVKTAKACGFKSINFDLIYGLPHQTPKSFARSLKHCLALDIDRFSIFNYAHLPERFPYQRRMPTEALPSAREKIEIQREVFRILEDADYQFIGIDHFAKKTDPLAEAQQKGHLHRNFQGYTTHGHCHLFGFGPSAISQVGGVYYQNHVDLKDYVADVKQGNMPLAKSYISNDDDLIRRSVIMSILCQLHVDKSLFEKNFGEKFDEYFDTELSWLEPHIEDGLVINTDQMLQVLPKGRLLVRPIASHFDHYFQDQLKKSANVIFSKAI